MDSQSSSQPTYTTLQPVNNNNVKNGYIPPHLLPFLYGPPYPPENILINHTVQQQLAAQPIITPNLQNNTLDKTTQLRNYIEETLTRSYEGDFQIRAYKKEFNSPPSAETETADGEKFFSFATVGLLIIGNEFKRTGLYDVEHERVVDLAKGATAFFECELDDFYLPAANGRTYGGCLYDALHKLRTKEKKLRGLGEAQVKLVKRKRSQEINHSEEFEKLSSYVGEVNEEFMILWSITLNERKTFYAENKLENIFKRFPYLARQSSINLIEADALILFPEKNDIFSKEIGSEIIDNIFKEANAVLKKLEKEKDPKNDLRKQNISRLLSENSKFVNHEHRLVTALLLLPYLFKKVNKTPPNSKKRKVWHPEQFEVQQTFIYQIKSGEDRDQELNLAFDKIRKFHNDHFVVIGPYIIIVGSSLHKISTVYVCIDDNTKYEFESFSSALSFFMDLTKVFGIKYSPISSHIWELIDIIFCCVKCDHPSQSVRALIKKLKPRCVKKDCPMEPK